MPRQPRISDIALRRANAAAALVVTAVFFAHAVLRAASMIALGVPTVGQVLMGIGLAVVAVHLALSAGTTYTMWTDKVRPASPKKKAHQMKKWVTGAVLVAAVAAHVWAPYGSAVLTGCLMMVAAIALCVHTLVGVKSLTRDLNLSGGWRIPARVVCIVLCAAACAVVAAVLLF